MKGGRRESSPFLFFIIPTGRTGRTGKIGKTGKTGKLRELRELGFSMIFLALLVPLVLPSLPPTKKPRVHIAEGFLCIFQIVKISERILGAQENPLRSLLSVNEKGIYRSATPKTPLIFAILLLRTPHLQPAKRHLRSAGARPEVHPAVRQPVRRCPAKQPAKQR